MKSTVLAGLSSTGNPIFGAYRTINHKTGYYGRSERDAGNTDYFAFFPISEHVIGLIATRDDEAQFFDIMDSVSVKKCFACS
jgi:hypothetical protein